jgi:hypothetical protein
MQIVEEPGDLVDSYFLESKLALPQVIKAIHKFDYLHPE